MAQEILDSTPKVQNGSHSYEGDVGSSIFWSPCEQLLVGDGEKCTFTHPHPRDPTLQSNTHTHTQPISFILTIPGSLLIWTCIFDGVVPNELSIGSYLVFGTLGTGIMILNYRLLMLLLQCFQVWFLIIMSLTFAVTFFSTLNDTRLCVFPILLFGLLFSITLDGTYFF